MSLIKKYILENKKQLIILLVVIIVMSVISFAFNDKKNKKIYVSEDYIYTKETYEHDGGFISELPYVNLKNNEIREINKDLMNTYYKHVKLEEEYMQYDYYIKNNIMSLLVKYYNLETHDSYPYMSVYNFDIDTGSVLSTAELLDKFSISTADVSNIIESNIREYYEYEVNKGYFEGDFDAYLDNTMSLPFLDNCQYYLTNDGLYVYKEIMLDSQMFYDTDSNFDWFNFKIK